MKINKITVFIVSLLIVLQLMTLGASAIEFASTEETATAPVTSDGELVNWAYSESSNMLIGGTVEYYRYEKDYLITVDPATVYVYGSEIVVTDPDGPSDDIYATIQATSPDSEIVWAYHDVADRTEIFATKEGARHLDDFIAGNAKTYMRLDDGYTSSWLSDDAATALNGLNYSHDTLSIEVHRLANIPQYLLYTFDSTCSFRYDQGCIFDLNGSLYYVYYPALDNSCFDAEGNLSFRNGSIDLIKLPTEVAHPVYQAIEDAEWRDVEYTYERDIFDEFPGIPSDNNSLTVFWVFYSLLGFMLPLPLLIMGIVLANSKKLGRPRQWYGLSGAAALWIIASAALMLVLLL